MCPEAVSTVFDVGAYTGKTAGRLGILFPHARIHAFEPSPQSFGELLSLAEPAGLGERLIPSPLALSSRAGERALYRHRAPQTDSLLETHPAAIMQWPDGRFDPRPGARVQTGTVDSYCAQAGIETIDILKIDAQGEDLRVLQGAGGMLGRGAIGMVVVEMYFVDVYQGQGRPEAIIALLAAHGLRAREYLAHAVDDRGRLLCVDALFVAPHHRGPS